MTHSSIIFTIFLVLIGLTVAIHRPAEKSAKEIIEADPALREAAKEVEVVHIIYMCHLGKKEFLEFISA